MHVLNFQLEFDSIIASQCPRTLSNHACFSSRDRDGYKTSVQIPKESHSCVHRTSHRGKTAADYRGGHRSPCVQALPPSSTYSRMQNLYPCRLLDSYLWMLGENLYSTLQSSKNLVFFVFFSPAQPIQSLDHFSTVSFTSPDLYFLSFYTEIK